jgi:hypothetical protein
MTLLLRLASCVATLAACKAVPASVLRVRTASELSAAIESGISHIHITEHLDLRELPARVVAPPLPSVFALDIALQTITVRLLRQGTSDSGTQSKARPHRT